MFPSFDYKAWFGLIFIVAPLTYGLSLCAARVTSGMITPSTTVIVIGILLGVLFSMFLWTTKLFDSEKLGKRIQNIVVLGGLVTLLTVIVLANAEAALPNRTFVCICKLVKKYNVHTTRNNFDAHTFVFNNFDGGPGESKIGVGPEYFEQYGHAGETFEVSLHRGWLGSVTIESLARAPAATEDVLTRSCWK